GTAVDRGVAGDLVRPVWPGAQNHAGGRHARTGDRNAGVAASRADVRNLPDCGEEGYVSDKELAARRFDSGEWSGDGASFVVFWSGGAAAVDDDAGLLTISRAESAIPAGVFRTRRREGVSEGASGRLRVHLDRAGDLLTGIAGRRASSPWTACPRL